MMSPISHAFSRSLLLLVLCASVSLWLRFCEAEETMQPTYLVKNGRSVGAILRDTRSDDPLLKRAEGVIQRAVREAGGHDLPVFSYAKLRDSGRASAIAIGTTGYMTQIFGLGNQVADLDDEGFYIFPTSAANALMVVVTGHTERLFLPRAEREEHGGVVLR